MNGKNQDLYLDFISNPSLADALGDANPGDTIKLSLEILVKSKDDKGLSAAIQPDSVVPEGFEKEPTGPDDTGDITPAPEPPGSLATPPVVQAMKLRKKGG